MTSRVDDHSDSDVLVHTRRTPADSNLVHLMQPSSTSASSRGTSAAPCNAAIVTAELTASVREVGAEFFCEAKVGTAETDDAADPNPDVVSTTTTRVFLPTAPSNAQPQRHERVHGMQLTPRLPTCHDASSAAAPTLRQSRSAAPPPRPSSALPSAAAAAGQGEMNARAKHAFAHRLRSSIKLSRGDVQVPTIAQEMSMYNDSSSGSSETDAGDTGLSGDAPAAPSNVEAAAVAVLEAFAVSGAGRRRSSGEEAGSGPLVGIPPRHNRPSVATSAADSAASATQQTYSMDAMFNISMLAAHGLNRSVASITTRPMPSSSHELTRRKSKGSYYLNNYRIVKSLGRGACGKVKLAFDNAQRRLVAIKSVRRADTRKRLGGLTMAQLNFKAFMREIEIMKQLRHNNIVSLYEVIDDPKADKLYLVMQYVERGVIAKVQVRNGSDWVCDPVPPQQLARYTREMLAGLQYLHDHNVVHRDIKPDNILVSEDGHAYLADFGVAETFDTSYRQRIEAVMAQSMAISMAMSVAGGCAGGPQVLGTKGTPLFIAPELWAGAKSYGKPVDMWAMGVTLFTLLVGKLPFRGPENITDASVTPTVPAEFGEEWRTLIGGLLDRDSVKRWTVERARGYVKGTLMPRYSSTAIAASAVAAAVTLAPTTMTAGKPSGACVDAGTQQPGSGEVGMNASVSSGTTTPRSSSGVPRTRATSPSRVTASSAHDDDGDKDEVGTLSRTESQVLRVDFLPIPDKPDITATPEEAPLRTPHAQSLVPTPPAAARKVTPGRETKPAVTDADDDGAIKACPSSGDASLRTTPNTHPHPPPVQRRTDTPLWRPGVWLSQSSMQPLPPVIALQQLPHAQATEVGQPRGRRPNQRTTLAAAAGGSGSASRSASRGRSANAAALHAASNAAAVAAALTEHHNDLHRQASEPLWNGARVKSPAASATTVGFNSPVFDLHTLGSFGAPAGAGTGTSSGGSHSRGRTPPDAGIDADAAEESDQLTGVNTCGFGLCHISVPAGEGSEHAGAKGHVAAHASASTTAGIQSASLGNTSTQNVNRV